MAVTLLLPGGSAAVVKVAVPEFSVAAPRASVLALLTVEKLTVPTPAPVVAVTLAVKVTLVPALTVEAEDEITTELGPRVAGHAENSTLAFTEPSPVTWS